MTDTVIDPMFLFQFSLPLRFQEIAWRERGIDLPASCRIPSFRALSGTGPDFGDLRMAWNRSGLFLHLAVRGKKQSLWCRKERLDESDSLHLLLAVRDVRELRRATRFCHKLVFLPCEGTPRTPRPSVHHVPIARASERPNPIATQQIRLHASIQAAGYDLTAMVPWNCLPGFQLEEQSVLGFSYAIWDRELGMQSLALGAEYPLSDPSLWGQLELEGTGERRG